MSDINARIAKVKGYDHLIAAFPKDWQHSIADAWDLVDELSFEWAVCLEAPLSTKWWKGAATDNWRCSFLSLHDRPGHAADAVTACEAICLAYLAVMEEKA